MVVETLKLRWGDQTRRIALYSFVRYFTDFNESAPARCWLNGVDWQRFVETVHKLAEKVVPSQVVCTYTDNDQDVITVSSNHEFAEALRRTPGDTLTLTFHCDEQPSKGHTSGASRTEKGAGGKEKKTNTTGAKRHEPYAKNATVNNKKSTSPDWLSMKPPPCPQFEQEFLQHMGLSQQQLSLSSQQQHQQQQSSSPPPNWMFLMDVHDWPSMDVVHKHLPTNHAFVVRCKQFLHIAITNALTEGKEAEVPEMAINCLRALLHKYTSNSEEQGFLFVLIEHYLDVLAQFRCCTEHPILNYNIACFHARTENLSKTVNHLVDAVANGFDDYTHLVQDADFLAMKQTPEFQRLLNVLQQKQTTNSTATSTTFINADELSPRSSQNSKLPPKVQMLVDMGFPAESAQAALVAHPEVEQAVAALTAANS